ncbi:MAG: ABC transporter substrate-binding protein [Candidatus Rokubacteria bacterium]|nr:ABC transporter substrate-binding protein [Candidatus Rokubacteria bacterium]
MTRPRAVSTAVVVLLLLAAAAPAVAAPEGQVTWGIHISLAPTWFDPAETTGIVTPFMLLYAIHDAMVKPLPGNPLSPSLAESWTVAPDGLTYDFVLRKGPRFHTGDPVTSDDVKFSFERYRGAASKQFKERVTAVETPDPGRVRFRLKQPWPDFLTFYSSATGAGWIVPKKYVEKVGDEGFKKHPMGAGPYRFVSYTPGVELVLEAVDRYWRKTPHVKRLVFKAIPDPSTRFAALKRGEIDVSYWMTASLGEELRRTQGLTLKPATANNTYWVYFVDQWDPKSPWHDRRVRLAANHAIDRAGINQAETLGASRMTYSLIPGHFEFFWQPPVIAHDRARAKQLLAEAGYPNGFDAGDFTCDAVHAGIAEPIANDLQAAGIRVKLRPLERAAYNKGQVEKKFKNLVLSASAAFGNAATRTEAFVAAGGTYVYGSYPDIDGLFREQAAELDRKKREATLHRIQQLVHEKAMFAPIFNLAAMGGYGPKLEESGLGLITGFPFSGPYEDVKLKDR